MKSLLNILVGTASTAVLSASNDVNSSIDVVETIQGVAVSPTDLETILKIVVAFSTIITQLIILRRKKDEKNPR